MANPLMNINASTPQERSYLLGLFLTDGYLDEGRKGSHEQVTYALQGNEGEIANRVTTFLERCCLKPRTYHYGNMIAVTASCTNLSEFLPDKETLLKDCDARRRFFERNDLLFNLGNRVAFCGGLIDGDGSCRARLQNQKGGGSRCLGTLVVNWSLYQVKYPYLLDFFHEFVDSLAPNSTCFVRRKVRQKKGEEEPTKTTGKIVFGAYVNRAGREALLRAGIAGWSWKVSKCMDSVFALIQEREKERVKRVKSVMSEGGMKLVDVAKMLGMSSTTLRDWHKCGKIHANLVCVGGVQAGRRKFFVIPKVEVENLKRRKEELLQEMKRTERTKSEGVKIADAAKMVGIPHPTLYDWCRNGKLHATMVYDVCHRYFVIPRDEIRRLKGMKELSDLDCSDKVETKSDPLI